MVTTVTKRDGPGMFSYRKKDPVFDPAPEEEQKYEVLDSVGKWRFDKLVAAGYGETQALWLALDRSIDLHKAVDLAKAAGPQMAFQIIS